MENVFQVDLRGVVDLLSHHLYSSPRVYARELLQNAVDAIVARRATQPQAPDPEKNGPEEYGPEKYGEVRFECAADGSLSVADSGIGLSENSVRDLLATIGRSSKRDELGFARQEFLGQFGIGLLSCFLVTDEIRVLTRAEGEPTVAWTGYSDGRYEVRLAEEQRPEVGTTVTLLPRRGAEHWLTEATVRELIQAYGSFLPVSVRLGGAELTGPAPWATGPGAAAEPGAARDFARSTLGIEPFEVIDLRVPAAGLTGVAYVLPVPANPAAHGGHRVYLKRMLLSENADGLLPEWAFFARCVVDTTELRPTASREALYEDGLLAEVREALGDQLRGWLVRLAATQPARLAEFLRIHNLGVKALALHDDEMLRLVDTWWPMETNAGTMTLAEFRDRHGVLRYSSSLDQFRHLAAVAAAQDVPLVNGGYTYDSEIIERLPQIDPSVVVERLDPTDLATRFEALDPGVELGLRAFLAAAQRALDPLGCEAVLRCFEPARLPAMYLVDRATAFHQELRATRDRADPLWADVLSALDSGTPDSRPQLVLNYRNPLVRRITALPEPAIVAVAVEALYGQALLLGYHPIRPADAALLNRSFLGLLDRALPEETP